MKFTGHYKMINNLEHKLKNFSKEVEEEIHSSLKEIDNLIEYKIQNEIKELNPETLLNNHKEEIKDFFNEFKEYRNFISFKDSIFNLFELKYNSIDFQHYFYMNDITEKFNKINEIYKKKKEQEELNILLLELENSLYICLEKCFIKKSYKIREEYYTKNCSIEDLKIIKKIVEKEDFKIAIIESNFTPTYSYFKDLIEMKARIISKDIINKKAEEFYNLI